MIRNAGYVMSLIIDPAGRAKKTQVGVDLTLGKVSRIGGNPSLVYGANFNNCGVILNDSSTIEKPHLQAHPTEYTEVLPNEIPDGSGSRLLWGLDHGVYSVEFEQGLLPLPANCTAMIINRSTIGRSGSLIRSSVYDPGFATPLMGAIMYVFTPIMIEKYARVAQILIFENEAVEVLYNGAYQGPKDFR